MKNQIKIGDKVICKKDFNLMDNEIIFYPPFCGILSIPPNNKERNLFHKVFYWFLKVTIIRSYFKKGDTYIVEDIYLDHVTLKPRDIYIRSRAVNGNDKMSWTFKYYQQHSTEELAFEDYFCNEKELRKMKLKKLRNGS